jgi:hypothetical protein
LIRDQGWTQPEAAKRFGIKYSKLRKYLSDGLAIDTKANRPLLEQISTTFGLAKIDLLWSSKLKTRRPLPIKIESDTNAPIFQLQSLLDEFEDKPEVERICKAIDDAYGKLVFKEPQATERARGRSYVDMTSTGEPVSRGRRRGKGSKKLDE